MKNKPFFKKESFTKETNILHLITQSPQDIK